MSSIIAFLAPPRSIPGPIGFQNHCALMAVMACKSSLATCTMLAAEYQIKHVYHWWYKQANAYPDSYVNVRTT